MIQIHVVGTWVQKKLVNIRYESDKKLLIANKCAQSSWWNAFFSLNKASWFKFEITQNLKLLNFVITAQLARSLANFSIVNKWTDMRIYKIHVYAMWQQARADNLTVYYRKKQTDVSYSCVCPVIDSEFCHNIIKVVYGSTLLLPCGSTANLTMLWWNSWSITGQTHEKLMSIC